MSMDPLSHDSVIAEIEAKIAAWTAVLSSYKAAVSLDGPLGKPTSSPPSNPQHSSATSGAHRAVDLSGGVGVFRDKSIKEAIKIFLVSSSRRQTNKGIAAGLQMGGIATTATNFQATVSTALGRMKENGIVLRFPDGWALAASDQENELESTKRQANPGEKPKRQRRRGRNDKTTQILKLVNSGPDGKNIGEIVDRLASLGIACSRDYVRVVTKRLYKNSKIDIRNGRFYAAS